MSWSMNLNVSQLKHFIQLTFETWNIFLSEFLYFFKKIMMEPVTSQPQFGFEMEGQGFFGQNSSVISGLENLEKANEITVSHGKLTCVDGN